MRIAARVTAACACIVLAIGVTRTAAAEVPRVSRGSSRAASGEMIHYESHHDPNSIRQIVVVGQHLVALTSAGHLFSFALPALRLRATHVGPEEVTAVGVGRAGQVIVGLGSGGIYQVDPTTLVLDPARLVKTVSNAPQWLGIVTAAGTQHVVAAIRNVHTVDEDGEQYTRPYTVMIDLASGTTVDVEEATTYLVDSKGRLWIGGDHGEWGGFVARLDLEAHTATPVKAVGRLASIPKPRWEGVYGFVELSDGQVWAYGGTSHMGHNTNFIARVDCDPPRVLSEFDALQAPEKPFDPERPHLPMSHIVQEPAGSVLAFSYSGIYRTDATLSSWKRVHDLALRYRWGRPEAVGSYPAVTGVQIVRGEPTKLVLATIGDGLITLDGGFHETSLATRGSLGIEELDQLVETRDGLVAVPYDARLSAWQLGRAGWKDAELAPPYRLDPRDDYGKDAPDHQWYQTRLGFAGDGSIFAVSRTGWGAPGTIVTAVRRDGRWRVLGSELSGACWSHLLVTSDGLLWCTGYGKIALFQDGSWVPAADLPEVESRPDVYLDSLTKLQVGRMPAIVGRSGQAWILADRGNDQLLGFSYDAGGKNPAMFRWPTGASKEMEVHDALPWSGGQYLLATEAGLRLFDPAHAKEPLVRPDLPNPRLPAMRLTRDGLGRIWMAGYGLWMVRPDGTLLDLAGVPSVGEGPVSTIIPDPKRPDGVIVGSRSRGVAFVRVEATRAK